MAQMVEHLLCKSEALSSNPNPTKKRVSSPTSGNDLLNMCSNLLTLDYFIK
jgi:hypothetical protein